MSFFFCFSSPLRPFRGYSVNVNLIRPAVSCSRISKNKRLPKASDQHHHHDYTYCAEEDYSIYLFVDDHVAMIATPSSSSSNAKKTCKPMAFHVAASIDEKGVGTKEAWIIEDEELDPNFFSSKALPLGTSKLGEILQAFKDSEDNKSSVSNNAGSSDSYVYDLMYNNCATLILNMMGNLGIPADDPKVIEYTAHSLFENGVAEKLVHHPDVVALGGRDGNGEHVLVAVDEKQLVTLLVEHYIANHGH